MTGSENSNARILAGECYCRAVRYAVADAFAYALNCHCSNCRRTTGSAFKPFAGIACDKLRIAKGEDQRMIYGDETGHDAHCAALRLAALFRGPRGRIGPCRDGNPGRRPSIRPTAHIFVGSKAPWYAITDDLPQYGGTSGPR